MSILCVSCFYFVLFGFDINAFLLFSEGNVVYFYTVCTLICYTRLDALVIRYRVCSCVQLMPLSHQITMAINFCIEFLVLSREMIPRIYFLKHFYEIRKIRLTVTEWIQKGPIHILDFRHILCCLDFVHFTDEFVIIITRAWWFSAVDIEKWKMISYVSFQNSV